MQTHKWHFQLLDRETEKVVKQNNKTSAWWHWRRELLSSGECGRVCAYSESRENDKSEWHFSMFRVQVVLLLSAQNKPFWACLKASHCGRRACACESQCQQTCWIMHRYVFKVPFRDALPSRCKPFIIIIIFLGFHILILIHFSPSVLVFFAASTSTPFTCYRPLTPPAITWVEETQVGRRNGRSFRYASAIQARLHCRNESAERNKRKGIKRLDESATWERALNKQARNWLGTDTADV